jgi:hypothetical protein
VSSAEKWSRVCELEKSVVLDPKSLCTQLAGEAARSPIDNFYQNIASLIPLGTAEALQANQAFGKVLLLGIVAATEHYFRACLAGLLHVCPIAHQHSASLSLSFGAIDYYAPRDLGLALLEHVSLATAGEVQKQAQRLVGIDASKNLSTRAALDEYEKLCQLRHAAVHSVGHLGHQNLRDLGVVLTSGRLGLKVEYSGFQIAADVCQNVVRSYNRFVFRQTVEKWIGRKVIRGTWLEDRERFSPLYRLFYSAHDAEGPSIAFSAYRDLLPALRRSIGLGAPTSR